MARNNANPGAKERQIERRYKALELRKSGASYPQIARQLGITTGTAFKDVQAVLKPLAEQTGPLAFELRQLETERLDAMLLSIAQQVKQGHLGAIDRAIRISESRRRLWGLDAPTKQDVTSGGEKLQIAVVYADKPE